jgi:putative transposase
MRMIPDSGTGSSLTSCPAAASPPGRTRSRGLCSQQRIWSAFSKKRGLSRKAGPPVHDDLIARQFTAAGPDQTWLTDITEHPTAEGKLYLCAIKDVYSNRIAGYSMDSRVDRPAGGHRAA